MAWDGDEVAGVVMNRVLTTFNEQTGERRGLLAGVSVRRPWRRRGLARALVAESLRALRDAGMTSAVLGVDADNPTGALGVYEDNGFVVHRRGMNYRRPSGARSGRVKADRRARPSCLSNGADGTPEPLRALALSWSAASSPPLASARTP